MGHPERKVYIVEGRRTPFGKFGGSLAAVPPTDLAMFSVNSLIKELKIEPDTLDQVIAGNCIPAVAEAFYINRHIALRAGLKIESTSHTVNRLCGSGHQTMIDAARLIRLREADAILAVGSDNLSLAPHMVYGGRFGTKYGSLKTRDMLFESIYDNYADLSMGATAENLVDEYNISREESDIYTYESHQRAASAYKSGLMQKDFAECSFISKDEHVDESLTLNDLKKLKASFKKEGIITVSSAAGVVDGSCAVLVASEDYVKKHNLNPLAEIIASDAVGCDPHKMGIGPAKSIPRLLQKTGMSTKDIDFFEINEAFAPQVLACNKVLNIDRDKLNIWGGAVSIGHPFAASGLRITLALARQLHHYGKNYGISSACAGGGQGISLLIKKV